PVAPRPGPRAPLITFSVGLLWEGGLPPPPTVHLAGTGAEKSGMCPALEVDLNCRQEFLSDGDCADNLKCCWLAVPPSARHPKQVSCPELDINYPQLSLGRDQCKANSRCQASGDAASVCGMASHITHVF
uniref:WAP domain-containing protein n=1 Tax=Sus scrofa TaxID=9823 RepID=A0A8D2BIS0_PIG